MVPARERTALEVVQPELTLELDVATPVEDSREFVGEERGWPLSIDEQEAEFQRQFTAFLSDEERTTVENLLRESGVEMSEVAFSGRMVILGDAYLEVDFVARRA
jgi:hypothetical protein